jgi:Dynein light intermediate chain (DLIC)
VITKFIKCHARLLKIILILFLVLKRWQEYMEPGDELEASSPMRHSTRTLEDDLMDEELPLGEGTLTRNLGLDMVIVVTKVRKIYCDICSLP